METNAKGQIVRIKLTGKKFGTVTVCAEWEQAPNGGTKWRYICDCGGTGWAWAEVLKRSPNFTCPECRKKVIAAARTEHGHAGKNKSSTYRSWVDMRGRCNNPTHHSYKDYGGRGITISSRWESFANFLEDMGERPGLEMTIERINNSIGYSKSNCKWATNQEQANNRRSNKMLSFNGKTQTYSEWSRELGIDKTTIRKRDLSFWPVEKILSNSDFRLTK